MKIDDQKLDELIKDFYASEVWQKTGHFDLIRNLLSNRGLQANHTPITLCKEMLAKLNETVRLADANILVLFNLEFVDVLIKHFEVNPQNITFFADYELEGDAARHWYNVNCPTNIITYDTKRKEICMPNSKKKFDVVVMNPPYQAPTGNKGSGHTLWNKFVLLGFDLLQDKGHLTAVHPSSWREPYGSFSAVNNKLRENKIEYLEVHGRQDGVKLFGAATSYDWYVVQKQANNAPSVVKQSDGVVITVDMRNKPFIPNFDIEQVHSIMAKQGEETCQLLHSESAYDHRKEWMSDEKNEKFKFPVVYTVPSDCSENLIWSSKKDKGHFGIPKIIISNGTSGTILDMEGKYGMSQYAYAIVDDPKILPVIQKAITSPAFIKLMQACSLIGVHRYSRKAITTFRKDFWKQFV